MILIKSEKVVIYARYYKNLFVFNFIKRRKAMIIDYKRLIYIISKNKQMKI